jgi:sigma-B regulation protein RsbU (phosphoserine phosphatase)
MSWLANISLKLKLTFLLVLLTSSMLTAYGWMALTDFEKDKVAYVLDSSLSHSRSAGLQIKSEISNFVDRVKFLMRGYGSVEEHTFHSYSQSIFQQESAFDACLTYVQSSPDTPFAIKGSLVKSSLPTDELAKIDPFAQRLIQDTLANEISVLPLQNESRWLLGLKFQPENAAPFVVVTVINTSHFMGFFESAQMQDTYLVSYVDRLAGHQNSDSLGSDSSADRSLKMILSPNEKTYDLSSNEVEQAFIATFQKLKAPEGIYLHKTKSQQELLISAASIGIGHLSVASVVPKEAALSGVRLIIIKSVLFLGLLICVTTFLAVIASTTLTASLKRLLVATKRLASGDFSTLIEPRGQDEVGMLMQGFNFMAREIQRLMKDTAEKARMEGELKTAKLVQSTLFPKDYHLEGQLEICGRYLPASECSGDWWFYERVGQKTLFCIGDATGHGVPAALLTAAARSAASALQTFPTLPLEEMMSIFNRSIYNTARGQVMMTLFLGSYDHETGVVTYTNASHDPPYLLPEKDDLKKKDLVLLNAVMGPRLGEANESRYETAQVQLQEGDRIMLYTDGVTELKDKDGKMWSERALVKCLIECSKEKKSLSDTMVRLGDELSTFRQGHALHDDVTYFMVTRSKAS